MKKRGISASSLTTYSHNKYLRDIIDVICRDIDANICTRHSEGKNTVRVKLPDVFEYVDSGLSLEDIQTVVYSEIVSIYETPEPEGRGFGVKLHRENKIMFIIILWSPAFGAADKKERQEMIRKHLK